MSQADLIISHAGAGSILEGLKLRKRMIVVVNSTLMHNHQQELAQELDQRKHLVATTPDMLCKALMTMRDCELLPMPDADTNIFPRFLSQRLGMV